MELPVRNMKGEVVAQAELSDVVFGAEMKADLLHQALVYHQANQRQGTSNTLTRANVAGGGKKPHPQKHTGRARMGSIRSPLARHGGIVFGPHPRSYRKQLPKRARRQAIRCALSSKVAGERLILVQDWALGEGKTKDMAQALAALGVASSALVVLHDAHREVALAVRNLPRTKVLRADLLNVLDLMRYDIVVMSVDAARRAEALWAHTTRTRPTEVAA